MVTTNIQNKPVTYKPSVLFNTLRYDASHPNISISSSFPVPGLTQIMGTETG